MTAQLMCISADRPDHREHQADYLAWGTLPGNSLCAWTASTNDCKTSSITLPSSPSVSFGDWAKAWYNLLNRGSKARSRFNVYLNVYIDLMYIQHATQNPSFHLFLRKLHYALKNQNYGLLQNVWYNMRVLWFVLLSAEAIATSSLGCAGGLQLLLAMLR